MSRRLSSQSGFSLVEMMVSIGVFMVLAGAAFGLLIAAQQRQGTESELLDSFQAARLSLDDIVRDVSNAGYPPVSFFSAIPADTTRYAAAPFAWSRCGLPLATAIPQQCLVWRIIRKRPKLILAQARREPITWLTSARIGLPQPRSTLFRRNFRGERLRRVSKLSARRPQSQASRPQSCGSRKAHREPVVDQCSDRRSRP